MARRSFLFRGNRRYRQAADLVYGVSQRTCQDQRGRLQQTAVILPDTDSSCELPSWSPPWSVLSCQTTGLDAGLRPIEIAVIDHRRRTLLDTLVNPGIHIPASATAVTGIADEIVSHAPRWRTIWPKLEALLLKQNHVVAWSAEFDLRAMRGECGRWDELTWTAAIDTRFVDLASIVWLSVGDERSFEDACALASYPFPGVRQQRALACCRAAFQIIQTLRNLDK